jgi:CheY-like chemotaxis protein
VASSIFVIDSSPAVRRLVEQISKQEGCEAQGFQDASTALQAARTTSPNFIIVDYHLDNMTFSGFCKEVHKLDSLAETYIVSLMSSSDRVDETHLRSLGVKAILQKPFQPENLIEIIKDLEAQQASRKNGAKKKSRAWPPVSSGADSDDDDINIDIPTGRAEEQVLRPIPEPTPQPKASPVTNATQTPASTTEPEDAMKGLFGQLLQSMSERTEKKIAELLPHMVGKELAILVTKGVETAVRAHIDTALSEEKLAQTLEPLLMTALPKVLSQETALIEPLVRQSVSQIASPLIKERIDQFVREELNAVRTAMSDVVREQLGALEGLVKEEVHRITAKQTAGMAEALVQATAREEVKEAVLRLLPDLAEEQIKAEITRLTRAA